MDLNGQIMNMSNGHGTMTQNPDMAYKLGHRDARHAAAELASKASVELAELRLLVRGIVENRSACFVPNDKEGLVNWDERAARVLGEA